MGREAEASSLVDVPQFGADFLTVSPAQEGCLRAALPVGKHGVGVGWGPASPKVLGFPAAPPHMWR